MAPRDIVDGAGKVGVSLDMGDNIRKVESVRALRRED